MKKRIIALFMAAITIFGMLSVPASAASLTTSGTVTIQQAGYGKYLSKKNGGTIGGGYWKYTSNDGLTGTAYCVNHSLKGVSPSKALTVQEYNRNSKTMGVFASGYGRFPSSCWSLFHRVEKLVIRGWQIQFHFPITSVGAVERADVEYLIQGSSPL